MAPVTVLYILGSARSGSSLLASLLGELPGCFATAETRLLWHGFDDRRCGCGVPVRECPVWRAAIDHAAAGGATTDPAEVVALQRQATRTRHVTGLLAGGQQHGSAASAYTRTMVGLYRGLAGATGAAVIVDSSKSPAEAVLLARSTEVRCVVLHLVRDARAVAHSWVRAARRGTPGRHQRLVPTAARWLATNLVAEGVCRAAGPERSLRLRYEDLVADPASIVATIAGAAGLVERDPPAAVAARVSRHMVGGNALRFSPAPVEVRADHEWTHVMPRAAAAAVTATCWPLLARYGYLRGRTGLPR